MTLFYLLIEIGLPCNKGVALLNFYRLNLLSTFVFDYYDFYPNAIAVTIATMMQLPARSFLYG